MSDQARRNFLSVTAKFLAGSAALAATGSYAGSHEHRHHGGSADGLAIDAAVKDTCGTCQYWGGMRKVSEDKKTVMAQSMGWCNNPDSMNYQKLTAADHLMQKTGMWQKWPAI